MLQKAQFDAFLKEYWVKPAIDANIYENHPLFGMMPKDTDAGGEYVVVPIDLDDGAEGSPTFSDAQAIATAAYSQKRQFQLSWTEDFQLAQIENKTIRLSRKNPEQALESAKRETKRAMRLLANRIARAQYRSGYGDKGRCANASMSATSTITLSNKADCRNFHIGDRLVFASSLTAALRDSGDYVTVTAVNASAGTVTTDAPTDLATSISSIGTTDFIFGKGMRGSGSSPTLLMIQGLASHVPTEDPSGGESFNGVDRSIWRERLAGYNYNGGTAVGGPIDEIIIDALVESATIECYPTHLFMPGSKWGELIKAMEGRYEKVIENAYEAKVGYKGIEINVGYGTKPLKVFPDPNCPEGYIYGLKLDDWKLFSAGEVVQNDLQHVSGLDLSTSSGVEYRYVSTISMGTSTPKHNLVIAVS